MVVVNLHRSIRKGMITWEEQYIGSLLESLFLKLEINGINMKPGSVLENEDYKVLWDFSIYTDHVIEALRPDFVVVPGDSRIEKEKDNIQNILGRELQKI